MNHLNSFKLRFRNRGGLAVLLTVLCTVTTTRLLAQDTPKEDAKPKDTPAAQTKPAPPAPPDAAAKDPKSAPAPKKKKLTGAELYAINCNRCHPERYATEFTSSQWKTIMTHMRVRANLPAAQAKEILRYLQEDSGN
jgi:cytochrome c5